MLNKFVIVFFIIFCIGLTPVFSQQLSKKVYTEKYAKVLNFDVAGIKLGIEKSIASQILASQGYKPYDKKGISFIKNEENSDGTKITKRIFFNYTKKFYPQDTEYIYGINYKYKEGGWDLDYLKQTDIRKSLISKYGSPDINEITDSRFSMVYLAREKDIDFENKYIHLANFTLPNIGVSCGHKFCPFFPYSNQYYSYSETDKKKLKQKLNATDTQIKEVMNILEKKLEYDTAPEMKISCNYNEFTIALSWKRLEIEYMKKAEESNLRNRVQNMKQDNNRNYF